MILYKRYWLYLLALLASSFVFLEALQFPFTYLDDYAQVVENNFLRQNGLDAITGIFRSTFVGMYQPITTSLYWLIAKIGGIDPFEFHLASLLVHLLNGYLVCKILRHFTAENIARFFSIVFLVHPLQVESVVWISAFSNLVYSALIMVCLDFFIGFCKKNTPTYYWGSLIFFIFAALSKSSAISLVLLLPFLEFYFQKKFRVKKFAQYLPFLLVAIIFGLITLNSREAAGHISDFTNGYGPFDRIFIVSRNLLYYPLKFLWPTSLSIFYPFPEKQAFLPILFYLALPGIILLSYLVYQNRRHSRIWFGTMFYLTTIILVVQIIPLGNQITTDRYLYLPMVGLMIILSFFMERFLQKKQLYFLFLIPIGLAIMSFQRTKVWQSDELLWQNVLAKYPNIAQAHNNLGSYYYQKGYSNKALPYFLKAKTLNPNYADAYSNLGILYSDNNESDLAIDHFDKAIDLKPHADAYFNRGNELAKLNRFEEAIKDYKSSISLTPHGETYTNMAYSYLQIGQIAEAQLVLNKALKINALNGQALFLMGIGNRMENRPDAACLYFKKAMKVGDENAKMAYSNYCL